MEKLTIGFGTLLVLIGVISFLVTGLSSITALIPAFVGIPLILCGMAMRKDSRRTYALFAALAFSLLLFLGSIRGLLGFFSALMNGKAVTFAEALQVVMVILSTAYIVTAIQALRAGNNLKV